jgi:transcriptional regulator with XRE-family HTH domain
MKIFEKHLNDKLKNLKFKKIYEEEEKLLELSMKIHDEREKKGMSQRDTAKMAKITQQQLSRIENGENCNILTFLKVCNALNLDIKFSEFSKRRASV